MPPPKIAEPDLIGTGEALSPSSICNLVTKGNATSATQGSYR
jgi:hypothetical protein